MGRLFPPFESGQLTPEEKKVKRSPSRPFFPRRLGMLSEANTEMLGLGKFKMIFYTLRIHKRVSSKKIHISCYVFRKALGNCLILTFFISLVCINPKHMGKKLVVHQQTEKSWQRSTEHSCHSCESSLACPHPYSSASVEEAFLCRRENDQPGKREEREKRPTRSLEETDLTLFLRLILKCDKVPTFPTCMNV